MILKTIIYTLVITNKMTKFFTARLKPLYDSNSITESLKLFQSLINCSSKETKLVSISQFGGLNKLHRRVIL